MDPLVKSSPCAPYWMLLGLLTCCSERRCCVYRCFGGRSALWGCFDWSYLQVSKAPSLLLEEQEEQQEEEKEQEELLLRCCCCGKQHCRRQWVVRCSLGWRRGWWVSTLDSGQVAQAWLLEIPEKLIYWLIHSSMKEKKTFILSLKESLFHCLLWHKIILHF